MECDNCDLVFFSNNELRQHKIRIHNLNHVKKCDIYKCDLCGKMNLTKELHSKVCTVNSEVVREESVSSTTENHQPSSISSLIVELNTGIIQTHDRIHSGDKPFKCKICNKSFKGLSNLLKHENAHPTEGPF